MEKYLRLDCKNNVTMIVGILELTSKTKYGMTSRNHPLYLFRPMDSTLPLVIVGCSEKAPKSNVLALVRVEEWMKDTLTRGELIRILGPCGDPVAETQALEYRQMPFRWSKHREWIIPNEERTRVQGFTFNVDPEGCHDIDDVITLGEDGLCAITIADVHAWCVRNPELWNASLRGSTIYDNGRAIQPMLPRELSENHCSLVAGQERLGVTLQFEWDGSVLKTLQFQPTIVENNYTYTQDTIYGSPHAKTLEAIASYLAGRPISDSHEWIEQLMLMQNQEAAHRLRHAGKGFLRTHSAPDVEKLKRQEALGADGKFLAYQSAQQGPASEPHLHWALGYDLQCHATSPIRRFADIVNQGVLKGVNSWEGTSDFLNQRQKACKQQDRDLFFLNSLRRAERKIEGIVVSPTRVWVPNWKRLVSCKNESILGTHGILQFSLNWNESTWKRRMVFKFAATDCPGSQSP